jgi:predicted short-subunit dehydrogenase-like oxidoreductase (DUF2520 family)
MTIPKIVLIGSGNMATRLGLELKAKELAIQQVYSPTIEHASELAKQLNASSTNQLSAINSSADLYIIAVKDDAVAAVVKGMPEVSGLVVHTSGSVDSETLNRFQYYGSLYPLQTVSKNKAVEFSGVPICIEGNTKEVRDVLFGIAALISNNIHDIDSKQRRTLHLAAVFACNFSNYMYTIAHDLLSQQDVDFKLLLPLILETAQKTTSSSPASHQTGPAVRNDTATMDAHKALLAQNADYQKIYNLLSNSITVQQNDKEEL